MDMGPFKGADMPWIHLLLRDAFQATLQNEQSIFLQLFYNSK